jgi:oxygen-independent coproporphyrinogen-3 oxidase
MNSPRLKPPFLGVYIHVPFCRRKCAYCGFYSVTFREELARGYLDAVLKEAEQSASPSAKTLYIGGGTPNVLPVELLERLLAGLRAAFPNVSEISVEGNPELMTPAKAKVLKNAGVTRLSLGIQSLSPSVLATIGRNGKVQQLPVLMDVLASAGFAPEQISFDVIYGIRGQREKDVGETLDAIVQSGVAHVSLYGFTLEPNSRLSHQPSVPVGTDETFRSHHTLIDRMLTDAGILRYELSNYARPGFECFHNLNYWKGGEWLGLGPAASGTRREKGSVVRTHNLPDVGKYVAALRNSGVPPQTIEKLSKAEELEEAIFLSLRLAEGMDEAAFKRHLGPAAADMSQRVEVLIERGCLIRSNGRLFVPVDKVLLTDEIAVELLPAG